MLISRGSFEEALQKREVSAVPVRFQNNPEEKMLCRNIAIYMTFF